MKLKPLSTCLLIALVTVHCNYLSAQNWNGGGDGLDWHDPANWDGNSAPVSIADFASIYGTIANPFNVEINQNLTVGDIDTADATLTINSATSARVNGTDSSIFNFNADLTGSLSVSGSQLNRTGGVLSLDNLSLGNTSLELGAADSSASTSVSSGAELTVSGASLTGNTSARSGSTINFNSGSIEDVTVDDATFNFNGGNLSNDLTLNSGAVVNRTSGSLNLQNLTLSDASLELLSGDSVSTYTFAGSGSDLTISGADLSGGLDTSDSTTTLNSGSISDSIFLSNSTLNWNGGTISGDLSVTASQGAQAAFNRNTSAALMLDSLSLTNAGSLELVAGDTVANSTNIREGSELTVAGASLSGSTSASSGGTINFNSGSIEDVTVDDATFNFNGGTLSNDLTLNSGAVVNRTSGALNLQNLNLSDSSLELLSGDSVSTYTFAGSGSDLTISGANLSGGLDTSDSTTTLNSGSISDSIFLSNSTLNWNGGTISGDLFVTASQGAQSTINRNASESFNLNSLSLGGDGEATLQLGEGDVVSGSTTVTGNSTLSVEGADLDSIAVSGNGTLEVNRSTATLSISDSGVANVTDAVFSGLSINGGTLNLAQGIVTGNVDIFGNTSTINRTDVTAFVLDELYIADASVELNRQDEIANLLIDFDSTVDARIEFGENVANQFKSPLPVGTLFIADGSEFNIIQEAGEITGVLLEDEFFDPTDIQGTINLIFDSEVNLMDEFDFTFAVVGDRTSELQSLIDAGQITISGNLQPVGVFFDAAINQTSIGFFTAVPEPSSLILLTATTMGLFARRRRRV